MKKELLILSPLIPEPYVSPLKGLGDEVDITLNEKQVRLPGHIWGFGYELSDKGYVIGLVEGDFERALRIHLLDLHLNLLESVVLEVPYGCDSLHDLHLLNEKTLCFEFLNRPGRCWSVTVGVRPTLDPGALFLFPKRRIPYRPWGRLRVKQLRKFAPS